MFLRQNITLNVTWTGATGVFLPKFRSCNLPLAIETGRYNRPKTPVSDRLCKYCHMDLIKDETHYIS